MGRRSVRAWLPHQAVADAGHHTIPVPLLAGGIVDQHAVHELAAEVAAVVPDPVALTDASSAKLMVSTTSGMNAASEKSFIDGCANRHPPHPAMQQKTEVPRVRAEGNVVGRSHMPWLAQPTRTAKVKGDGLS